MSFVPLSRRQFLTGSVVSAGAAATYGFGVEPRWLEVTEHPVPVVGLPRDLDGFRVAQITDAHLKTLGKVEDSILEAVRAVDAQVVVLTGDIVDSSAQLPTLRELCFELERGGRSLIATLGNWEHWGGLPLEELAAAYKHVGADLLVNDSRLVQSALRVVATDDATAGKVRFDEALCERESGPASLFLTHSPELLDRIPSTAGHFDLALAGHTHGGQVRLGSFAPALPPGSGRFVAGWYDVPTGRAYVSRGTGLSVVPARLCCRPELAVFTLRQG